MLRPTRILVVAGAILIGLILARLPLLWAALGLTVVGLIGLALIHPLAGLGVSLIFATFKPLTDYFVPELPLDIGQLALIITLGIWLLQALRRRSLRIPHSPFSVPLLIFIGAASLSLVGALSVGFAVKELVKWAQILVVMWIVIDEAGAKRWPVVIGSILAAAAVQALIGVWQFGVRGEGPEHFRILGDRFYRAYGTFEQPNPYGGFIGLVLPLAIGVMLIPLTRWFRVVWLEYSSRQGRNLSERLRALLNRDTPPLFGAGVLVGLLFAALVMSWSRGAWLGFGAAGLVLLFAWPRKAWIGAGLVIGALAFGLLAIQFNLIPASIASRLTDFTEFTQTFDVRGVDITPENYAVIERLAHWQAAQEMARFRLVFGIGFGNYEPVYPAFALVNWPYPLGHAHNIYLNMLAETGVIGFLAYIALWVVILWKTWCLTRSDDLVRRSIAIGLLGTWTHLSIHHLVDKLYVANIHLHLGAMLGILSVLILTEQENMRLA